MADSQRDTYDLEITSDRQTFQHNGLTEEMVREVVEYFFKGDKFPGSMPGAWIDVKITSVRRKGGR